ncbi:helix-turn-helix domain-containing protein [Bdellovibrio sp. BCCA]|uniref:helix-turn-helix domain-containing protein n=1 Tax=Bdellovibrio sp. BCCA TaxID=3136281 RepID=UPI0030F0F5C1
MKRRPSIFSYPIVLKQTQGYLAVTCPDLQVTIVEPFPKDGKISSAFLMRIAVCVGKAWAKMNEELKRIEGSNGDYPKASFIRHATSKDSDWVSVPMLAKLSGDSENTIRRAIDRGDFYAEKSPGGHRSLPALEAKRYLKELHDYDWDPYDQAADHHIANEKSPTS